MRRGVERKIEDRKLLERPESAPEFLESDPWRVLRIQAEFVAGLVRNGPGHGGRVVGVRNEIPSGVVAGKVADCVGEDESHVWAVVLEGADIADGGHGKFNEA